MPRTLARCLLTALLALGSSLFMAAGDGVQACACGQPVESSIASTFDLAANGLLPASYPQPAPGAPRTIPDSLLKAVGWVESGWRQYAAAGQPLVSFDFGYGIMQITSGMAGAFGNPVGDIDPSTQSQIASNYVFNIAYGAAMLAAKWMATPAVGDRDPSVVENWYYALWAYNGWGWVNNPNNPRFSRQGTPATDPSAFPYQERVLYFVAHPPRDDVGNLLWTPVHVSLPSRRLIGRDPGPLPLKKYHVQPVPAISAVYKPQPLAPLPPGGTEPIAVTVRNTGTSGWSSTGANAVSLTYHVLSLATPLKGPITPFTKGVVAYQQGAVPLPRPVLPGKWYTVHDTVTAPSTPGSYLIAWDLEQGSASFSGAGSLPEGEPLSVFGPGTPVITTPTATPSTTAQESLRYIADLSVPDGTNVGPGQEFVKTWLVYNDGRTAWGTGWSLQLIRGRSFGSRNIPVPPTNSCRSAILSVSLRAPAAPGRYRSAWRLVNPSGAAVGDTLTVVIVVSRGAGGAPTVTPVTPTPSATPSPPTPTATPVG